MPNLTFYVSKNVLEYVQDLSVLTQACQSLCIRQLGAAIEKVHIMFIPVQSGCGKPVYAELIYRLLESRSPEVMNSFMHELDQLIQNTMHVTPRIRCFAYPFQQLHAYN